MSNSEDLEIGKKSSINWIKFLKILILLYQFL